MKITKGSVWCLQPSRRRPGARCTSRNQLSRAGPSAPVGASWIWLVARIWLGWEWLQSGWGKVFGGNITLRFWEWGQPEYTLTGDANPWMGPMVAIGEVVIGVLLILGLFTGIAAALGAVLNFSFVFAGTAGVNPAMILVSFLLILAWRNAGWIGLDRWVLPALGTPWHRGRFLRRGEEPDDGGPVTTRGRPPE